MSFDPNRIYAELIDAGNDWADKDAAASLLEESKKSMLSELMLKFDGTAAMREAEALASSEYREHVRAMIEARRLANKARVRYGGVQTLAEMRRTQESTRRQEMKLT